MKNPKTQNKAKSQAKKRELSLQSVEPQRYDRHIVKYYVVCMPKTAQSGNAVANVLM